MKQFLILDPTDENVDQPTSFHEKSSFGYTQWSEYDHGKYLASRSTYEQLPAGMYEILYDRSIGDFAVCRKQVMTDELYELPTTEVREILDDLQSFWQRADLFSKYKFLHKRGILLYGPPGCGKSGLIQLVCKNLIETMNGLVFNINTEELLENYISYISKFREVEPNRPIVVVFEDIDEIIGDSKYQTSSILNLLDGVKQINNVVYIATTNYPEKLQERVSNRPSRFDRRYNIDLPSDEVRKAFFVSKLGQFDDLDRWVADSKGFSLAHCKEVVISTVLLGNTYEYTMNQLGVLSESSKSVKPITGFNSKGLKM